jgi:hypothetical protein
METWLVIEGCKNLYGATDHQPLVTNIGKQSVADVPNKRLARIKEKTMSWRFNMIYNPGKLQSAADAILTCKPLHMLYISVSQTTVADENEDVKELMEIELYVKEPSTWSAATPRPT